MTPTHNENGLMRCYNMFPTNFKNIDEMTAYLPHLKAMGFNVVWVNPLQLAGDFVMLKNTHLGQHKALKGSMYAMADTTQIDPRFSVVKRDKNGNLLLSNTQKRIAKEFNFPSKDKLEELSKQIQGVNKELATLRKNIRANKNHKNRKRMVNVDELDKGLLTLRKKKKQYKNTLDNLNETLKSYKSNFDQFVRKLDDEALRNFTSTAKSLGITPIFDLVLNHVAINSPITQNPKFSGFFNYEDKTFPDATAFIYSRLIGSKRVPAVVGNEREKILNLIPEIIDEFWKPFLEKYILDYGFCGVRVDCVKKIPAEVRKPIYEAIKELVAKSSANAIKPIILEETLFTALSVEDSIKTIQSVGATHNIASIYYKQREWHGGLPYNYNEEAGYKQSIVENGVINFTGNHDHHTCALTVCRTLAYERFKQNNELFNAYLGHIGTPNHPPSEEDLPPINCDEFIYFYVKKIIEELHHPEKNYDNINRFGMQYRDKMLTSIFSGSGGYYMLSGDEFASFHQPSVFVAKDGSSIIPTQQLKIFTSEHAALAESILEEMASQSFNERKLNAVYKGLSPENKKILCSSMIEHLKNEINGNNVFKRKAFIKKIKEISASSDLKINENLLEEMVPVINHAENKWSAPKSMENFASSEFISEVNHIVEKLPTSKPGFWSELFKAVNNNLFIAVRMNGIGYSADTDVIIFNINPNKTINVNIDDIHKIALWFQNRGFKTPSLDNPDYHKAYGCIMGSEHTNQKPANLHFGGKISLDSSIKAHCVSVNGKQQKFNIITTPDITQNKREDRIFKPAPETSLLEETRPMFSFGTPLRTTNDPTQEDSMIRKNKIKPS